MERSVEVATGESVAFVYELAGLGSRFFAVFVDLTIQVTAALAGVIVLGLIASTFPGHGAVSRLVEFANASLLALVIGWVFLTFSGYFIILEWLCDGRTPGKRVTGIRCVRDGGFPLDFASSFIRNTVRLVEIAAGCYAVSAVAVLLSPHNRRFGDMAAGTIVVRDGRYERETAPGSWQPGPSASTDPLASELTSADRDLIRRYVCRRTSLGARARATVAAEIVAVVRPKLSVPFAHLDDDDLLVHLARSALS